jgi:hypothetical protein
VLGVVGRRIEKGSLVTDRRRAEWAAELIFAPQKAGLALAARYK